jgi:protein LTV1
LIATYTNTENHPAVIRSRTAAQAKARAAAQAESEAASVASQAGDESDSGSETETEETARFASVTRPKGESKEDRKARKAAVKAERAVSLFFPLMINSLRTPRLGYNADEL